MQIRKSLQPALPALRPITPGSATVTPRGIRTPHRGRLNKHYQTDFQVNRSLFLTSAPLKPFEESRSSSLDDLNHLVERLKLIISEEKYDVYTLSPILDRILCSINFWDSDRIRSVQNDKVILDLQNQLFNLIEIDDFLLRSIICRILLLFAQDPESHLLLPIAKIFYSQSCDSENDSLFEEEKLDSLLLKILDISKENTAVYIAGALRNISSNEKMARALATSSIFQISYRIFQDPASEEQLLIQLAGCIRNIARVANVSDELSQYSLLGYIFVHQCCLAEAIDTLNYIDNLTDWDIESITKALAEASAQDEKDVRLLCRGFSTLLQFEANYAIGEVAVKLLRLSKPYQTLLTRLLDYICTRLDSDELRTAIQDSRVILELSLNDEYDTSVFMSLDNVLKNMDDQEHVTTREKIQNEKLF